MKSNDCLSSDGKTQLHLMYWLPKGQPKGIIQLIHGMAEYIARYQEFAEYLTGLGYIVVGHDHLGHGESVDPISPNYGYFNKQNGYQHVVDDIHQVRSQVSAEYPKLPYVLFGHSMGSFALRCYLQNYHEPVAGVILMGTGAGEALLPVGRSIARQLNRLQPKKVNQRLDQLAFGSYSKQFSEESRFNWLSKNQKNVQAYEADTLTGFTFTNNGFHTLFSLIHHANKKGWAEAWDKNFPVLVISGEQDPVGHFGDGIKKVANTLSQSGIEDISMVLYAQLRHELLFEEEKQAVYETIGLWVNKHLS